MPVDPRGHARNLALTDVATFIGVEILSCFSFNVGVAIFSLLVVLTVYVACMGVASFISLLFLDLGWCSSLLQIRVPQK